MFQLARVAVLSCVMLMVVGCQPSHRAPTNGLATLEGRLVLLTRDGCSATQAMHDYLEEALPSLGYNSAYEVQNMAEFDTMDPRRGYGSPTLLFDGVDLFGLAEPAAGVAYAPT